MQDNICNVDSLRLLQSPLPLPMPRAMLWKNTQHVIDDLHIANHKKESCHEKYNPSRVKEIVPEANLVCAEQVEGLGTNEATKTDVFSEKFQMAFDPPPHFRKIILRFFFRNT